MHTKNFNAICDLSRKFDYWKIGKELTNRSSEMKANNCARTQGRKRMATFDLLLMIAAPLL